MLPIVLASTSPRRKELLQLLEWPFIVDSAHVDESFSLNTHPHDVVMELSKRKATAVASKYPQSIVIGSDTLVVLNNQILGKPRGREEAYQMIKSLSGKTHSVCTGVSLCFKESIETFYSEANVQFYSLTEDEINTYINTNEPYDKAGAYAIQGLASKFIRSIKGDYYTIVGLPIAEIYQRLKNYK